MEKLREEFAKRAVSHEKNISALCREYGISRPTGYKWINRYINDEGLSNQSRAPFHTHNKISSDVEELIVEARKKEPGIGARKMRRILMNKGYKDLPCTSTFNAVLKRNHLITPEASLAAKPCKRFEKEAPNVMWQTDFKGYFSMKNGENCHPLSILDDHSRFCLCADAKANEQRNGVEESFKCTFRKHGMPQILLCDNGNPWGTSQSAGYTGFEVWLMDYGILTVHIRALHPQTQGKTERFNRSYKDERLKFYVPSDLADADRQRQEYREFYNNERPHNALKLDVPAEHYQPSERKYTDKIVDWEYASEYEVRKVKSSGYFNYGNQGYFLSEAFADRKIALKQSSKDGLVNIYYRKFRIGRIDMRENVIVSRRAYLIEGDPRSTYGSK